MIGYREASFLAHWICLLANHQIAISSGSVSETAFITPDGHYENLRMPFGLVNAPAVFQRAINSVFENAQFGTVMAYLDDVLLSAKDFETGIRTLAEIFELFRKGGIDFFFFHKTIEYLGH